MNYITTMYNFDVYNIKIILSEQNGKHKKLTRL